MTLVNTKHLLMQGLFLVLLVGAFFAYRDYWLAILPVLAVIAWIYVGYALLRARRQRMAALETRAPPDRTIPERASIIGTLAPISAAQSIDPEAMTDYLCGRIIGQQVVARQIARSIYRRMAQERRGKPVFTALLSGPTGTGKTEMVKAVADYLYGDASALFRVDCANVIGEAGLQTLIGSPKGYAGSGSWGALTAHLRASPQTVILFDEIEKAVPNPTAPMAKLLLSLLDEGICTEQSDGTQVSATQATIFLTSNAAQDKLGALAARYGAQDEELVRATKDALRDFFAPEFLARIDLVTTLAPLDQEARAEIIALHTRLVGKTYGVEVSEVDAPFVDEALRLWSTMEGYGTREVIRWIEQAAADELISVRGETGPKRITWRDGAVVVQPQ